MATHGAVCPQQVPKAALTPLHSAGTVTPQLLLALLQNWRHQGADLYLLGWLFGGMFNS